MKDLLKLRGTVIEVLPGTKFIVEVKTTAGTFKILAYISGKMRMHYIKLQRGDSVELEVSPTDLSKGRITYRGVKNYESKSVGRS